MRKGLIRLAALLGLGGCVAPPPPAVPPQALLGAFPGPGKTEAAFQQDDAACQAAAAQPGPAPLAGVPAPAATGPGVQGAPGAQSASGLQAAPGVQAASGGQAAPGVQAPPGVNGPQGGQAYTPGMVYLRCMVVHGDTVQPVVAGPPAVYAYYVPYPVYYGIGDYDPWLFGGVFDVAFFGGFYGGFGRFGFARFGYGYGHGFGYRGFGGYGGFHDGGHGGGFEGGFHGGGGFRR